MEVCQRLYLQGISSDGMNRYWYSAAEAADGGMQPLKKCRSCRKKGFYWKRKSLFAILVRLSPKWRQCRIISDPVSYWISLSPLFLADMPCPLKLNTLSAPESWSHQLLRWRCLSVSPRAGESRPGYSHSLSWFKRRRRPNLKDERLRRGKLFFGSYWVRQIRCISIAKINLLSTKPLWPCKRRLLRVMIQRQTGICQFFVFRLSMMMSWQQSPSDRSEYLMNSTCFLRLL